MSHPKIFLMDEGIQIRIPKSPDNESLPVQNLIQKYCRIESCNQVIFLSNGSLIQPYIPIHHCMFHEQTLFVFNKDVLKSSYRHSIERSHKHQLESLQVNLCEFSNPDRQEEFGKFLSEIASTLIDKMPILMESLVRINNGLICVTDNPSHQRILMGRHILIDLENRIPEVKNILKCYDKTQRLYSKIPIPPKLLPPRSRPKSLFNWISDKLTARFNSSESVKDVATNALDKLEAVFDNQDTLELFEQVENSMAAKNTADGERKDYSFIHQLTVTLRINVKQVKDLLSNWNESTRTEDKTRILRDLHDDLKRMIRLEEKLLMEKQTLLQDSARYLKSFVSLDHNLFEEATKKSDWLLVRKSTFDLARQWESCGELYALSLVELMHVNQGIEPNKEVITRLEDHILSDLFSFLLPKTTDEQLSKPRLPVINYDDLDDIALNAPEISRYLVSSKKTVVNAPLRSLSHKEKYPHTVQSPELSLSKPGYTNEYDDDDDPLGLDTPQLLDEWDEDEDDPLHRNVLQPLDELYDPSSDQACSLKGDSIDSDSKVKSQYQKGSSKNKNTILELERQIENLEKDKRELMDRLEKAEVRSARIAVSCHAEIREIKQKAAKETEQSIQKLRDDWMKEFGEREEELAKNEAKVKVMLLRGNSSSFVSREEVTNEMNEIREEMAAENEEAIRQVLEANTELVTAHEKEMKRLTSAFEEKKLKWTTVILDLQKRLEFTNDSMAHGASYRSSEKPPEHGLSNYEDGLESAPSSMFASIVPQKSSDYDTRVLANILPRFGDVIVFISHPVFQSSLSTVTEGDYSSLPSFRGAANRRPDQITWRLQLGNTNSSLLTSMPSVQSETICVLDSSCYSAFCLNSAGFPEDKRSKINAPRLEVLGGRDVALVGRFQKAVKCLVKKPQNRYGLPMHSEFYIIKSIPIDLKRN